MAHDSTSNGRELLARLRQRLAGRIGPDRCAVWFGKQVEFRYGTGILSIATADLFSAERLRRTFRSDLESLCKEHFPQITRIDFVVDEVLRSRAIDEPAAVSSAMPAARPAAGPLPFATPAATGRNFARLEDFIVGDENRVAHAAACAAPSRLGTVSPLFLHGPTGCGKTHVLEGIWSAVRRATPRARCVYLSAEQFTIFFLEALRGSGLPSFRHKYREVQLLAIDDVQFFGGKRATLVEFLHTIDTLHRAGGQLVLAADRPPSELAGLGPELIARMSAGLVCGLAPPQASTRRVILSRLAQDRQMTLPPEVRELLADRLPGDARRLGGALNRLRAASEALDVPITLALATQTLTDLFQQGQRPVELPDIERAVCEVFGMDRPELHSPRKAKAIAQPRMLAMWLARKYTRSALQDICRYFGRRSHSTVISAEKAVATWMEDGAVVQLPQGVCDVREAIRRVEARLNAG
jgi:chromosomal replication initiator protein